MASNASIAARYTKALFQTASSDEELGIIAFDMERLQGALEENPSLVEAINNNLVASSALEKTITDIADQIQCHKLTRNFLRVLATTRRLNSLPAIFSKFNELLSLKRGELTAKVTSARRLKESQVQHLSDTLSKKLGYKIIPEVFVDPEIVGGIIINVGSYELDASLRTQLNKLKNTLRLD